jgi:hypothetical protein
MQNFPVAGALVGAVHAVRPHRFGPCPVLRCGSNHPSETERWQELKCYFCMRDGKIWPAHAGGAFRRMFATNDPPKKKRDVCAAYQMVHCKNSVLSEKFHDKGCVSCDIRRAKSS